MEALRLQLHSLGTHISVSEGFSEIWEAFIHRTPDLQSSASKRTEHADGPHCSCCVPSRAGSGTPPPARPAPHISGHAGRQHRAGPRSGACDWPRHCPPPLVLVRGLHAVEPASRPRPCSLLEGPTAPALPCGSTAWVLP